MLETQLYTTSAAYVYRELRHRIITKKIKAGQRLPEVNIAVQMGVSRTPVREALRRLESEGLVDIVPNSGARLASPSRREMESAYVVREQLECLAARLAAQAMSEKHFRRLEEIIGAEEEAFRDRNLELYLEINEAFHRTVAEATGNRILASYVENILARTNVYIVFYDPFYEDEANPSMAEHKDLLRAFRDRDGARAELLMRDHLRTTMTGMAQPEH